MLAFEDTGAYRLLLPAMSEDPGELQRFYAETVEPLVAYDDQYETDLVQTLETFLECDGNVAGTAQRLFTHRHTVRYRLERVRDLSGLDVSSTDGREKLGLGLKAMRVLGIAAPRGPATERGARGGRVPPQRQGALADRAVLSATRCRSFASCVSRAVLSLRSCSWPEVASERARRRPRRLRATRRSPTRSPARTPSPAIPRASGTSAAPAIATIQGFATDISVNQGETVRFKVDTTADATTASTSTGWATTAATARARSPRSSRRRRCRRTSRPA